MAKTSKSAIKTQETRSSNAIKAKRSAPKPSKKVPLVISPEEWQELNRMGAKALTSMQISRTVAISDSDDEMVDRVLRNGSQVLVDDFEPRDAVESTLVPVIVGIKNAVMTGLGLSTNGFVERRDVEINLALKGAGVLAELLQAFDAHRGHGNRRVTVGNVNVESGAQAIVGNVETTSREEPKAEGSTIEPNKPKTRAV
jgi:hypothetical protein